MKFLKRLPLYILLTVPLLAAVFGLAFRQEIRDWFAVLNFVPPDSIVELVENTTMTDEGRKLFYIGRPELNDRHTFWQNCSFPEETIVLGCFTGNNRIFIFDVEDDRLDGVREVTAAHEMLHVAYGRLGGDEKERIDGLLATAFDGLKDKRIADIIESYREIDDSHVSNELHSILGTEVAKLPRELEKYYARYFENRQAVVSFAQQYVDAFAQRRTKIDEYDKRLKDLRTEVDDNMALLGGMSRDLELERNRMNQLRANGQTAQYNAAVGPFNRKVGEYNRLADRTDRLIDEHNELVKLYNDLVFEQNELMDAIDSRPETL